MSKRAPCTFRVADVRRAIKAAKAEGVENARVVIDRDGNIAITWGDKSDTITNESPLDQWIAKHARHAQGN
jgi:hypothetical protein